MPRTAQMPRARSTWAIPKPRPEPGIPYADIDGKIILISKLSASADRRMYVRVLGSFFIKRLDPRYSYSVVDLCVEGKSHVKFHFPGDFRANRDQKCDALSLKKSVRADYESTDCDCFTYDQVCPQWLQEGFRRAQTTLIGGAPRRSKQSKPKRP